MLACCFVHRQRARQPDETATRIVVEVSAAIFRFGSSLPRDVCNRLYVLDAPRSPCRILYQGHVSGWLRSCLCLEDDGSVCRDPTCHLARPKPIDPVELRSLMHRIHHILRSPRPAAALNNLAGLPRTGLLNLADAAPGLLGCFRNTFFAGSAPRLRLSLGAPKVNNVVVA
jgi:hypothetical protein